jgi:hypothetical protein
MQTRKLKPYNCEPTGRTVPIVQILEWVSGIDDERPQPVLLAEACAMARRCPKLDACPLSRQA